MIGALGSIESLCSAIGPGFGGFLMSFLYVPSVLFFLCFFLTSESILHQRNLRTRHSRECSGSSWEPSCDCTWEEQWCRLMNERMKIRKDIFLQGANLARKVDVGQIKARDVE